MTRRHMMIFRAVCENDCNSTRAAQALHMTQPAVSLAVRELEEYYGVHLFDRMGRRLHITEAGRIFLQYAIHICDLFDDMETGMRNWDAQGVLRVGASITIGTEFLPGYIKAFSELRPQTDVRAVVEPSDRLEQKILKNDLDCALIEGIAHDPAILSEAYMEDYLSIICPKDAGWQQGEEIPQDVFGKQRFLLREKGSGTRELFDRVMEQAGIAVTPVFEAMSTTALIRAVENGLGVAVLPYRLIAPALAGGRIITISVPGLDFRRSFNLIYHRNKFLTSSARDFLEVCRQYRP